MGLVAHEKRPVEAGASVGGLDLVRALLGRGGMGAVRYLMSTGHVGVGRA